MVMVTIALVMAVIVTNIYAKKESPERAPDWCIAIVSHFCTAHFHLYNETGSCLTNANRKRKKKSSTATCNVQLWRPFIFPFRDWCIAIVSRFYPAYFLPERFSNDLSGETGSRTKNAKRKRKYAADGYDVNISTIATGCDQFPVMSLKRSPLAYCRKLEKGADNETGNGPARKPEVANSGGGVKKKKMVATNSFELARYDMEWRLVAKFTDRVFFWIFLALSACVQTLLFIQMVPSTRNRL